MKKGKKLETLEYRYRYGVGMQRMLKITVVTTAIGFVPAAIIAAANAQPWQATLWVLGLIGVGLFVRDRWRENAELGRVYETRLAEMLDATWHAISFDSQEKAAEFVAAIGAHMRPIGHDLFSYDIETEISATSSGGVTTLYLSASTMDAVIAAFGAAPLMRELQGKSLPKNRVAVLVGGPDNAVTSGEVLKRLPGTMGSS